MYEGVKKTGLKKQRNGKRENIEEDNFWREVKKKDITGSQRETQRNEKREKRLK